MTKFPSMQNKTRNCFTFIAFFLSVWIGFGQETTVNKSLTEILTRVEETFQVRFSYAPEDVRGIQIKEPDNSLSLNEVLDYLNKRTPLYFSEVSNRYITIELIKNSKILCGKVVNAYTGEFLDGATIRVLNDSFVTASNKEGYFYLPEKYKNNDIQISFIGFETVTVSATSFSDSCTPIFVTKSINQLQTVLLTNYLTKGIKKEYNGATAIDTEDFGLLPGQVENDVLQLIQALPGVESVDETISNINIRGGSHSENLVLWNDMRMFQNSHFFGLISAFNPELTKKVTLFKNGTNPRYGESTSSVIAMESRNTLSDSLTGMAGINLINASVALYIPVSKKMGIELAYRNSLTNLFTSPLYHTFTDRIFQKVEIDNTQNTNQIPIITQENFKFLDFGTNILFNLSNKDKFRTHFLIIENILDLTETNTQNQQSVTNELEQESFVLGASWERRWNTNLTTKTLVHISDYTLHADNENLFSNQQKFQRNGIIETGLKLDAQLQPTTHITWQAGYQFFETGVSNTQDINLPRFRLHEKKVLRTHVGYLNFKYHSTQNKTVINAGLRANYFAKFNTFLAEPRFSIYQKIGNGFSAEAQGEIKSQTITQRIDFESDFLGIEKRRWVLVDNKDTPIIKNKQLSVGILYKKKGWYINLQGFIKEGLDITTREQAFQNQFQFINEKGDYIATGAELIMNKKTDFFSIWLSYVYMKNNFEFYNLTPSVFPNNNDIRHSATLASSFSYKNFKIAPGIIWRTGKPYTTVVKGEEYSVQDGEEILNYNAPNAARLSDYYRVNISAEYTWKFSKKGLLKANMSLLNVFNTKNTLDIRYKLNKDQAGNVTVSKVTENSLGFSPNFSLKLYF